MSGVSISVGPGEVVSVIGRNGGGKSTLLKAVTVPSPSDGRHGPFRGQGCDELAWASPRPDGTGFVLQTKNVFDTLTVTESLEMDGYLLTKPQLAATIDKAMSTFLALANMRSRTASMLSGGERKMLAVAPVLLVEQKAVEPLGVSDWACILVAGRVEIAGTASEILGRPDIREVYLGQSGTDSPVAQAPWTDCAQCRYPDASDFGSRAMTETGDRGRPRLPSPRRNRRRSPCHGAAAGAAATGHIRQQERHGHRRTQRPHYRRSCVAGHAASTARPCRTV